MGIEDLFNQLSNARQHPQDSQGQPQNLLGTIESKQETILIFDLSGKKVVSVELKEEIETNEYGERISPKGRTLTIKFENNKILKYSIPKALSKRKTSHTFTNGILEVSLKK